MTRYVLIVGLLLAAVTSVPRPATAQEVQHAEEFGHGHDMEEFDPERFERRHHESMLMWTFNALGWRYTLMLPASALLAFVLTLGVVIRGGPYAGWALLFIVPMPVWVGALGFFDGMIMSYNVIAMSETSPKPSEIAFGISTSLVTPVVGMVLMTPAYLVAAVGLFIRTLMGEKKPAKT
jgi:hypothetical protein